MSVTVPQSLRKRPRYAADPLDLVVDDGEVVQMSTLNIQDSSGNSFDNVAVQTQNYVKVGPLVFVRYRLSWTGTSAAVAGDLVRLTGFPFVNASQGRVGGPMMEAGGALTWPAGAVMFFPIMLDANSYLRFAFLDNTGVQTSCLVSDISGAGAFRGSFMYSVT